MSGGVRNAAVLGIGAAVLAFVLFYASTVDARPPSVTAFRLTHPLATSDDVALTNSSLEIEFSEPVDRASAEAAFQIRPTVEGTFGWRGSTMSFTPDRSLPLDAEFEVVLAASVRDAARNVMEEASEPFRFRTVGRPRVVSSIPARGAVVGPDAAVEVTFSTLMDTAAVERALRLSPRLEYVARWSGDTLRLEPAEPLEIGAEYELTIDAAATDVAGNRLARPYLLTFSVVAETLEVAWLMPADGVDGISTHTPVAVGFAAAVDPESLDEALTITPEVAGSLDVIDPEGAGELAGSPQTIVRFLPSASLPPNTTFEVELAGVESLDGSLVAPPLTWSFTTGVPTASLQNRVVFLSERAGVSNLWGMNPDGTNQHQLSAELSAVTDYAVSPDGSRFVVGDGARLVELLSDGGGRRVLTEPDALEFDPSYSADGRLLAFGRAAPATGGSQGIWVRDVGGADAEQLVAPAARGRQPGTGGGQSPPPDPAGETPLDEGALEPQPLLRAPRWSPDGLWLAFVDTRGGIGMVDLATGLTTWTPFDAASPPSWSPNGRRVVVAGIEESDRAAAAPRPGGPVPPIEVLADGLARSEIRIAVIAPGEPDARRLALPPGAYEPNFTAGGGLAYLQAATTDQDAPVLLWTASGTGAHPVEAFRGSTQSVASFGVAPRGERAVVATERGLWLVDLSSGERQRISRDGDRPGWVP